MSPVSRTLLDMPKSAILHILLWSTRTLRAARSRWIICGHITSVFSKLNCNGCHQEQSRLPTILQVINPCLLLTTLTVTPSISNTRRQPTARVPSVARGTIFNGTLSELKYSNYDLIKNGIFNYIEAYNSFKAIPVFTSLQNESFDKIKLTCFSGCCI